MDTPLRLQARWKDPRIYMDESGYRTSIHILRAPAAVFAALFTILFIVHLGLAVTRQQIICAFVAAAALLTAVGYWLKFVASSAEMLYAAQTILFVAPFLINFYIYTLVYRLYSVHPTLIRSPKALFWSLLGIDAAIFVILVVGLAFLFAAYWVPVLGTALMLGSFVLESFLYLTILSFLGLLFFRAWKRTTLDRRPETAIHTPMIISLIVATVLLLIRALYYLANTRTPTPADGFELHGRRTVRLPSGRIKYQDGFMGFKYYEPGQLGLDAAPVFLALLLLALPWAHPSKEFGERKGTREARRPRRCCV